VAVDNAVWVVKIVWLFGDSAAPQVIADATFSAFEVRLIEPHYSNAGLVLPPFHRTLRRLRFELR